MDIITINQRSYLSAPQAAFYMGISVRKLRDLLQAGVIKKINIDRRVMLRKVDIDRFMDSLAV